MASITIRNLDESVKKALRRQAAQNGHSMEQEARFILRREFMRDRSAANLADRIREIWAGTDGLEGIIPPRDQTPIEPRVKFDEEDE